MNEFDELQVLQNLGTELTHKLRLLQWEGELLRQERQYVVSQLYAGGMSYRAIAQVLSISPQRVGQILKHGSDGQEEKVSGT